MDSDYAYRDILPAVAASKYTTSGFMGVNTTFSGDDGLADRIYEDYNDMLADLYIRYRVSGVADWARETLGWGFRGQTYHLPGLEIGKAAMITDVPECDNNGKGDGIRYQARTANITGRVDLTMEAMTGPAIGYVSMEDVLTELGQNYSDGVTRAVMHGSLHHDPQRLQCRVAGMAALRPRQLWFFLHVQGSVLGGLWHGDRLHELRPGSAPERRGQDRPGCTHR